MLGGTFWVAFLRNGLGAALILSVFLLLERPGVAIKRIFCQYAGFWVVISIVFSLWYSLNWENYIRYSGMVTIPVIGSFCIFMSRENIYLSLYKLTFGFYLLSVVVCCGVDLSRICFGGNLWVDIFIRVIAIVGILLFFARNIRPKFIEGADFLREEMDSFSAVTLVISILFSYLMTYGTASHVFSMSNMVRILVMLFMAGLIQYMVFELYLHRGRERRYQAEKELLEINEQLLRHQLELLGEARREEEKLCRHFQLIEEYIKNSEIDKLFAYVKQNEEEIKGRKEAICKNEVIDSLLFSYARYASGKKIQVRTKINIAEDIAISDFGLIAILANVFENAIHGCLLSGMVEKEIYFSILQKGNKIAIQCKNTSQSKEGLCNSFSGVNFGYPAGASSIVKVVSYYNGETDFDLQDGMFVVRILLNFPAGKTKEKEVTLG